ncbi:putative ribonuclease H-like domain-containing protein [Tanacetum coccineum]
MLADSKLPTNIRSIDQKYYSLVVTNDFSRFTWTFFLGTKDETFYVFKKFIALIENQLNKKVKGIRCDNGTEFKNAKLIELCGEKGIKRDYSNPRTPQQNGVAERKNRTLIEAARTMLADSKLPTIFGSTNKAWCDEFEVLMKGEFEMSVMGEMTFFLGLQVKQLPDGIFISQDKYVKDMLTKFDMESVRTATTPYEAAKTKLKDETDPPVNVHLYRSMIGSLMYLTASRPDIMFAVSACSRHQVTPLTSHLNAVKKIFKYLKGQPKLGLWYPKDSPFQLEAYSDSDYAGSHGDRKSTTGGCQFLGRRLISWQCKKQTIVATSSTEAEYVAAASCCAQVLWIQNQLLDYGFNFMNTKIFIDNQSTICIVKNPVFHQRTKHIEIRHHFIRDANEKNLIQVLKIHTDDNVADLLTKAFDGPRFEYLVVHIGMMDMVLVSAGSTMILLVVNLPAGCFVSAGRCVFLLSAWFLLFGCLFLLAEYIHAAGVVYAAYTSIYAAELVCAGSIMFLLADLFLLVVTCFCCLNLVSAVLSLILLAGWSLPLVTSFLLVVSNHAGVTMYLLPE